MKKIKSGSIIVNPTDLQQGGVQDSIEDRSAYLRSDDAIVWSGTDITFSSDIVLDLINTADGSVKSYTIATAQSPIALANNESAYISIDRTASGAATVVLSGTTPIPTHSSSDKDVFVLFRRKDTVGGDRILHIPLHKQAIEEGQSVRLGASGSGGGGAGGGLDVIHSQNFETLISADFTFGQNVTYKTAGPFGGTLSDNTSTPLFDNSSPRYTAGATSTNDWFDIESLDIDLGARGEDLGITFWVDASNFSVDFKFVVWDNTNGAELTSVLSAPEGDVIPGGSSKARYSTSVTIPSNCTSISYGFHMTTAPVDTEYFEFDDFTFSLNPFVFKDLINTQSVRYDTLAGHGSTNTKIPYFSGVRQTDGSGLFTVENDSTNGFSITILKDCILSGSFNSHSDSNAQPTGFSINSNQLTTGLDNIDVEDRLCIDYSRGSSTVPYASASFSGIKVQSGDVIRPHSAAAASSVTQGWAVTLSAISESEHIITPQTGDDSSIALNTGNGFGSTNTLVRRFSNQTKDLGSDVTYVDSATDGSSFTIERSGLYSIQYSDLSSSQNSLSIYKNETTDTINSNMLGRLTIDGYQTLSIPLVYLEKGDVIRPIVATAGTIVAATSTARFNISRIGYKSLAAALVPKTAYLKDVKASGTNGGSASTNTVQTRDLNTVEGDDEIVSLSSNQFTLASGKYKIKAKCPALNVNSHQAFLYNVTDSTYDINGSSAFSDNGLLTTNSSYIEGEILITSTKTYEIRHWTQTAKATNGLGVAADSDPGSATSNNPQSNEVYAQVEITKIK